ncbi:hypothetical protein GCM10012286_06050 [Streptomyces lasiicapitis]|uniref:Uncharacterized protein n=1 Tax=Streptomyces lasiicapitis TaxID=1923961 RepID=A0ABQ2LID3_9ACTN|nr:hypothetical protein GCM10012286_06050 [Streptomyces lasiicapitis]
MLTRGRGGGALGTFDGGNSARDTGDFIFGSSGVGELRGVGADLTYLSLTDLSEEVRVDGDFSPFPPAPTACAVHPHARVRATTAPAAARPLAIAPLLIASPTSLHRTSLPEVFPMSE